MMAALHLEAELMATTRFARITVDPAVMGGKPCLRALRFPVSRLLGLLAAGQDKQAILADYPYLEPEDIRQALRYAAWLTEETIHPLEQASA